MNEECANGYHCIAYATVRCSEAERSGRTRERAEQHVSLAASEATLERAHETHRAALSEREQLHALAIAELRDTRTLRYFALHRSPTRRAAYS